MKKNHAQVFPRLTEAKTASQTWRKQAKEDFDFVAGSQYSAADRAHLESQSRPVITFNRVGPVIDAIRGAEIQNRQQIHYFPREQGDVNLNESLTKAALWIREQCDAGEEESEAFTDMVTCGMGWMEMRMDYRHNPEGMIKIERIDPFEMYWDPAARKPNLTDMRWVLREKKMNLFDFIDLWPDHGEWAKAECEEGDLFTSKKQVTLREYQYQSQEIYVKAKGKHKVFDLPQEKFEALSVEEKQSFLQTKSYQKTVYRQAIFCEKKLLVDRLCPGGGRGFTFMALTGKQDRNRNIWYGLVHAMKDPQRWANKWLSQVLHIINSNAKGGLLAERNAFVNPHTVEEEWADPSSVLMLKEGGLNKIKPKPIPQYPTGLDRLMDFAITSIRDVTGVNMELLGLADRQQAGVVEYSRKQASIHLLSPLFQSLKRYRKSCGRLMLAFMREYIADGRLMRLEGQKGQAAYEPLYMDHDIDHYDVIVDEGPSTPQQKEQILQMLMQLAPLFMKAGIPIPKSILDYTPLPASLAAEWKQHFPEIFSENETEKS